MAKQGIDLVIRAARLLAGRGDILFVICGGGPLQESLRQSAAGLANVRFLPLQPAERFNALLNTADVHLLPQEPGLSDLVMPSKLGPMLASGRPVIAAAAPASAIARAIGAGGICVAPGDAEQFADAVAALGAAPDRRRTMGEAARAAALRQFDQDAILPRIEEFLTALAAGKK